MNSHLSLIIFYSLLYVWNFRFLMTDRMANPLMETAAECVMFLLSFTVWLPLFYPTDPLQPVHYWNKMVYSLLKGVMLVVSLTPILTRDTVMESVQIGAFLMILIQETVIAVFLGVVIIRWFQEEEKMERTP